jgi:hypothetical protein
VAGLVSGSIEGACLSFATHLVKRCLRKTPIILTTLSFATNPQLA